jgi:hypothetical protein
MSVDWFATLSDTMESTLSIHSPISRVTFLLIFGTKVSTVGWDFLGLLCID